MSSSCIVVVGGGGGSNSSATVIYVNIQNYVNCYIYLKPWRGNSNNWVYFDP